MAAPRKSGESAKFRLSVENEQADVGRGPKLSSGTKLSGANRHREILFFLVELTTSRNGNLTRLIHTLL